jgi:hypothetical protein
MLFHGQPEAWDDRHSHQNVEMKRGDIVVIPQSWF